MLLDFKIMQQELSDKLIIPKTPVKNKNVIAYSSVILCGLTLTATSILGALGNPLYAISVPFFQAMSEMMLAVLKTAAAQAVLVACLKLGLFRIVQSEFFDFKFAIEGEQEKLFDEDDCGVEMIIFSK